MGYFELQSLVGTEIIENEVVTEGIMGRAKNKVKWTVIEAYPHFVRAMRQTENGAEIYCTFNEGTLVTMGVLAQKGKVEYYG